MSSHTVTLRYFAAARAAAGTPEESFEATSLADAIGQAAARHGEELGRILATCTILLDGTRAGAGQLPLPLAGPVLAEALPPFAGG